MSEKNNTLLSPGKYYLALSGYVLFALSVLVVAPFIGSESIGVGGAIADFFNGKPSNASEILFQHRLPRIILGFVIGAALSMSGAVLQIILRNPLAAPSTLGITGAASVGAALAIMIPALRLHFWIFSSVQIFALAGAIITTVLIFRIARNITGLAMQTLLLAGITINILCQALVILLSYMASPDILLSMNRWMMGGLDIVGYRELLLLPPLLLPGIGILFMQTNSLNHLALGTQMALGHGVDVQSVQKWGFIGASLCTAGAVALAGPVAFVGLLGPHIVRGISGNDNRIVLPGAFLAGGAFLVLCDTLARSIIRPNEIPVGIITAILGGFLFIWLLLKNKTL